MSLVLCFCKNGHRWEQRWDMFDNGRPCPECGEKENLILPGDRQTSAHRAAAAAISKTTTSAKPRK